MNWKEHTDRMIGKRATFTADEVRDIIRRTLEFECDSWMEKRR